MPAFRLSLHAWKKAIQNTKLHTAAGPDGLLLQDFLVLPDMIHSVIVEVLNSFLTHNSKWPINYCDCIVSVLKKIAAPASLSDYRPLAIYSLIYRLWSKAVFPSVTSWLCTWIHPTVRGFLPNTSTSDISYQLLLDLHSTRLAGGIISGVILDIYKCFDVMDRKLLYQAFLMAGFDAPLLHFWFDAVWSNKRRFRVNSCFSDAIHPTRGFGQGDSLSICPLLLLGHMLGVHLDQDVPGITHFCFADNLAVWGHDLDKVLKAAHSTLTFLQAWQLTVQLHKGALWSSCPAIRAQLRTLADPVLCLIPVLNDLKDLGAHLCFTKAIRSATQKEDC